MQSMNQAASILPDWGPYSKEYIGLSHVADQEQGHRWDCFLMPGYHRRAVVGPYALRENRWHWWKASPDLSFYQLRYELEWKDQVYVDLTVEGRGDARRLIAECVNRTALPVNLDLHLAASLALNPLRPAAVRLPAQGHWIAALDYKKIYPVTEPFRLEQVADARRPGERPHPGAVKGETLGGRFFTKRGDRVIYSLNLDDAIVDAQLILRWHRCDESPMTLFLRMRGLEISWHPKPDGCSMSQSVFQLGDLPAGAWEIKLETLHPGQLLLEGMAVLPRSSQKDFRVEVSEPDTLAEWTWDAEKACLRLAYPGLLQRYELRAPSDLTLSTRRVRGNDVPGIVSENANRLAHPEWVGQGDRETRMITVGPICLQAGETREIVFHVGLEGAGTAERMPFTDWISAAHPQAFGLERLAATTLTNVVFPVRRRDRYIKHYCPGRCWDSLYTWDSGMIGLGLASLDIERAKESLDQYLMPPTDPYAAFVEHGTPLPIQAEQAMLIWNKTHDLKWLASVFPKLLNFYEWLAGRSRGSTTDRFQSGLLQTWDYFYNSGGWDDYPPQHALSTDPMRRRRIAPCVTTAYALRFAQHLSLWAEVLEQDVSGFRKDIVRWQAALEIAWDPEAGHYSYVEHDEQGAVIGFYRHESGENFNRGFDGIIPLIAGGLPEERRRRLIDLFFDGDELWTPWGGTTVSKRAAYYSDAGYWNGAVWIPHNVMIWKVLRELGETEKAHRLADALLTAWERECRASYHTFEMFRADTGRGAGWHQFSGLTAPLLIMHLESQ